MYEPQPGTIPHRALAWMRSMRACGNLGPFPTAELCEAIGTETWGFAPFMRPARERGVVHTTRTGRAMHVAWALGDGKPDPTLYARPVRSDCIQRRVAVPLKPWKAPTFRAVESPGGWVVTGVQIVDGAAVFTREQFAQLVGAA